MRGMKYALGFLAIVVLNSCNTSIGLYRDSAQAYQWTKQKIQESNGGGGGGPSAGNEYGAPVY